MHNLTGDQWSKSGVRKLIGFLFLMLFKYYISYVLENCGTKCDIKSSMNSRGKCYRKSEFIQFHNV